MKVTLLQTDIQWADESSNLAAAEMLIRKSEEAALYLLPEMFSTGFVTNPEDIDGGLPSASACEAVRWMHRVSSELSAAVAGSVAVKADDGTFRNRFYFVTPDGRESFYDKHHLFTYGNEDLHYTGGKSRTIVEWGGVRFMLQVCYDLRFPVFSRNSLREPYDCCIYVASWPSTRRRVWDSLLLARALENQCYVLGVNRIGDDPKCHYDGGTRAIDARGNVVAMAENEVVQSMTIELDMERLAAFREKFPVLRDADV